MINTIVIYLMQTFSITKIKIFLSLLFSYFCVTIWWYNQIVEAMYVLLILDFLFWFIHAWKENHISKKKMQLGTLKLIMYSFALIVFNYASIATWDIKIYWIWIRELWVAYLAINETLSCLKHLWNLWVPIPRKLIKKLEWYKENLDIGDFKSN